MTWLFAFLLIKYQCGFLKQRRQNWIFALKQLGEELWNLSLTYRNLKDRSNNFVADYATESHDPEQSPCNEGGDAVDVSEAEGLALHCLTHTVSSWQREDIFPLNSFTPWRSRVQSMYTVSSAALCYLSSSFHCPTVGFQHVTWLCGPRRKESKLMAALGMAGTRQHEDCRCFGTRFPAKHCQLMRDMRGPQALAKLWDCA